jgi:hypothetical protein
MTQIPKTEKPTGVFWCAFLAEKCILNPFYGPSKKSGVQPARHEPFTNGSKTGNLFATRAFSTGTISDDFLRNSLKINWMAWKRARTEQRQNRVTYNNMPCAQAEKRTFLGENCAHLTVRASQNLGARKS